MMTMDDSHKEQALEKTIRGFRRSGWWFLLMGSGMLVFYLFTLFDPEGKVTVNGVETRDFGTKLVAAAIIAVFPAVGSLLAFLPQNRIKAFFRHILNQADRMFGIEGKKR